MKRVFVDTNIIVDLIADRKPFSKFALEIFSKAEENKIELFTSSHSVATAHYLLKKHIEEQKLRQILDAFLDYIKIIAVDQDIIRKSLKSAHKDFEDAVQIFCAHKVELIDCIVTRNIKDFKLSEIPVLTPDELVRDF
ncbi:MAG: PIN domain-containing protein [Flavobacterium sp.]|nr:MAG: PIN domain-containing protein [Flavobacterium sp.]